MSFDFDRLREMVRAKKEREGLTYRDIFDETKIAATTVCNFINGRRPEADTAAQLASWVGLSVDHFNGHDEVKRAGGGDTLKNISELIKADDNLTPEGKKRLSELMKAAYKAMV